MPYSVVLTNQNQNQALVTLCLRASLKFINCDLYAASWWPMIGNKLYSILFCSFFHVLPNVVAPQNNREDVSAVYFHKTR